MKMCGTRKCDVLFSLLLLCHCLFLCVFFGLSAWLRVRKPPPRPPHPPHPLCRPQQQRVALPPYRDSPSSDKLFFLETSKRDKLSPRQACAIESAARYSGFTIRVLVYSAFLNVSDNATCHTFFGFPGRVFFYQAVMELELQGTPLLGLYKHGAFEYSRFREVHLSDALRMALLYKYSGWYLDLDFVVLHPLPRLVGNDNKSSAYLTYALSSSSTDAEQFLINGALGFWPDGHQIPRSSMEAMARRLAGEERGEIGQELLTEQFRKFCKVTGPKLDGAGLKERCPGVRLLPPETFLPIPGYELDSRWRSLIPMDASEWNETLRESLAAHFYSGRTAGRPLARDPTREPYSYLAELHCPLSYFSSVSFM